MNGKKPNKAEQQWLDKLKEHGCCVCKNEMGLYSPCEIHHINGGSNHLDAIGLCMLHHRGQANTPEYVSRHPFKAEFEARYGSEDELLLRLRGELL